MWPDGITDVTDIVFGILSLSLGVTFIRLVLGPSLPDRVVALELTSLITAGMIVTYAIASGTVAYLDVAIVLALIAFLATVAFGRYLEKSVR